MFVVMTLTMQVRGSAVALFLLSQSSHVHTHVATLQLCGIASYIIV